MLLTERDDDKRLIFETLSNDSSTDDVISEGSLLFEARTKSFVKLFLS